MFRLRESFEFDPRGEEEDHHDLRIDPAGEEHQERHERDVNAELNAQEVVQVLEAPEEEEVERVQRDRPGHRHVLGLHLAHVDNDQCGRLGEPLEEFSASGLDAGRSRLGNSRWGYQGSVGGPADAS